MTAQWEFGPERCPKSYREYGSGTNGAASGAAKALLLRAACFRLLVGQRARWEPPEGCFALGKKSWPEGLGEVELPFPMTAEPVAFEVSGDSMLPKYENGDVIVVYREQRYPLSSFYGEEAAVRLKSGERYLKTIERGSSSGTVNLKSFNAKPINGVKLEWIGEICVTLPRGQIERLRGKTASKGRKSGKAQGGRSSEK